MSLLKDNSKITLIILTLIVYPFQEIVNVERYIEIPIPMEKTSPPLTGTSDQSKNSSTGFSFVTANPNFDSRFLTDFDMIQCLGKGGFGVVFEAKNKLDDCRYAVKRIVLPTRKENRDRVMREVKTLANCEHQNIVRFFQAWVEQPPIGWQEDQDKFWLSHGDSMVMATSIDMEGMTTEEEGDESRRRRVNMFNNEQLAVSPGRGIYTELNTDECLNLDEELVRKTSFLGSGSDGGLVVNGRKLIEAEVDEEDEDSFIEFRYSTNNDNLNDNDYYNDKSRNDDDDESTTASEEEEEEDDTDDHKISIRTDNSDSKQTTNDSVFGGGHSSNKQKELAEQRQGRKKRSSYCLDGGGAANGKMYLYIQMQLCQKQSLKEWLQLTRGEERQVKIIPIFEQIIKAVEYVHMKGLIHRDLKPSNIFFALDGTIKVGDFGLVTDMEESPAENAVEAKEAGDEEGEGDGWQKRVKKKHTQQVGTHLYMSPEQLNGGQYDYKVDIYSLGLILFELLVVFSTEMERVKALMSVRQNSFPVEYLKAYESELELLRLMLSDRPQERPTTIGIRARPPLNQQEPGKSSEFHFELPSRRKDSRSVS